jgi:hypothetical protein
MLAAGQSTAKPCSCRGRAFTFRSEQSYLPRSLRRACFQLCFRSSQTFRVGLSNRSVVRLMCVGIVVDGSTTIKAPPLWKSGARGRSQGRRKPRTCGKQVPFPTLDVRYRTGGERQAQPHMVEGEEPGLLEAVGGCLSCAQSMIATCF